MTTSAEPLVSIIIPAYNEETRLPRSLEKIVAFVQQQPEPMEVLVVENGSHDRTTEIAEQYAAAYPFISVLHSDKGKGVAVRAGMMAGRGRYLFICDSDLSMPITELRKFLPPVCQEYDVAIGSREGPGCASLSRARLPASDGTCVQPDRAGAGSAGFSGHPVWLQEFPA